MSCFHPLKGFPIGVTENGKTKYKIVPFVADHLERVDGRFLWTDHTEITCNDEDCVTDFVVIPCGKCVGCRLEQSRQWANRALLEMQYHDESYFITLTYDDVGDHLPRSEYIDDDTGEVLESATVRKRDWQLFMKRLRRAVPDQELRFMMSAEYGDHTYRPHMHAIIFGLHLRDDDLHFYKFNELHQPMFISDLINSIWTVKNEGEYDRLTLGQIGYAVVCPASWETCAYTARYVMKKLKGDEKVFYEKFALEEPFALMSRRPGIGRMYFDDHKEKLFENAKIHISTGKSSKSFMNPKYFNKLFDIEYPEESAIMKEQRKKFAIAAINLELQKTDKSYLEYLADKEEALKNRTKKLVRSIE